MSRTYKSNHPPKGASIKVEPIRKLEDIQAIKTLLKNQPRNLCLFTLGINTAYRANELMSIRLDQVRHLKFGDRLDIKQSKNKKYRGATLNHNAVAAINQWLTVHPFRYMHNAPLFLSQRTSNPLTVSAVNHLVKKWCHQINLPGNYGSHTLRKTWGYHQRTQKNKPLTLLTTAYGHTSEFQTLEYLCIQSAEVEALFIEMEL